MSTPMYVVSAKHLQDLGLGPTTEFPVFFKGHQKINQVVEWIERHRKFLTFDMPSIDCVYVRIRHEVFQAGAKEPTITSNSPLNGQPVAWQLRQLVTDAIGPLSAHGRLEHRDTEVELYLQNNRYTLRFNLATIVHRQVASVTA